MIIIELKDGQTGYDVVAEYVRRYWTNHYRTNVVVSMAASYDGTIYHNCNDVADLDSSSLDDVEFSYDWWEGEKFIRIDGICAVDELEISGGIYTE